MCNKIKQDVKRSIDTSLKSSAKASSRRKYCSQQVTKRDIDRDVRDSIENYRRYFHETAKNSPLKSIKHQSRKSSAKNIKVSNTVSPFSTVKSRGGQVSNRTRRKVKTKQALSKLDNIYKELQSIEDDYTGINLGL